MIFSLAHPEVQKYKCFAFDYGVKNSAAAETPVGEPRKTRLTTGQAKNNSFNI